MLRRGSGQSEKVVGGGGGEGGLSINKMVSDDRDPFQTGRFQFRVGPVACSVCLKGSVGRHWILQTIV